MKPLERVLHIEDDPAISRIARVALESIGKLDVASCSSGHEAIETAPAFDPDLLLVDVMMPTLDGPSTVDRLSQTLDLTDRPVVYMTARGDATDLARYQSLGAAAVIVKPFDPMKLADELRSIWQAFHER